MDIHYDFILYPEGLKKLQETGLDKRIQKAMKKQDRKSTSPYRISDTEVILENLEELKEEGYFKTMPFNFVEDFGNDVYQDHHQGLINLASNPSTKNWEIITPAGRILEPIAIEDDFPIISGYYASITLNPAEFWDFKNFGFKSLSDFFGTIGTFTEMQDKSYFNKRDYSWKSKEGERLFITKVGGSEHGDFRLSKTDITPYKTFDPLFNEVSYRPETQEDARWVSASHSIEPYLLAALLRYAEQEKISSDILKNPLDFIAEIKKGDSFLGPFGDAGDWGPGGPRFAFIHFAEDIPRLDSEGKIDNRLVNTIPCYASNDGYGIFMGPNHEFVFSYIPERKNRDAVYPSEKNLSIPPQDLDHFIRGLFIQCKNGLGRTSLNQMVQSMNYYFSDEYQRDMKEYRTLVNKSP